MTTRRRHSELALAAVLLLGAAAAARQPDEPGRLPPVRGEPVAEPPAEDPGVKPAQFARPAAPASPGVTLPTARGLPPVPPTPAVQLVVLVPQDVAPKTELTYTVKITNASAADAHRVRVKMPVPDGTLFVKAEPKPDTDATKPNPPALEWNFKTVEGNGTRTIQVTVRPKDDAREIDAKAYVSFEHGQQVKTRINAPKLKVKTEAPKQAVAGQSVPVRVTVTNDGRVPIQNVRLTGNIPQGFEFDKDTSGEKTKTPGQRVWELGTLPPGGSRQVAYQVLAKEVRELVVQSVVDGSHQAQVSDEAKTAVKEAKIRIELKGDGAAAAGEPAGYEAVVTNTGTLPLTNVRVTAQLPDGCKATAMTHGGREGRDQITWVIPKMAPDDRYAVRWKLASAESGRKTVRAAAAAAGVEHAQQVETVFKGAADLHWETAFDQPTVPVDRSGMLTVKVKNTGSEPAKNVRLVVGVPREVRVIRATPGGQEKVAQVVFEARDVPAGKVVEYSLQFRGEQPGQAHFQPTLYADVLGADPLRTNKYVEIVRR